MNKINILNKIKGGLIVSCQALDDEPLHSAYIMSRMAVSAQEGGACGIRANSVVDITEIKKLVSLPLIGLVKIDYPESEVYITPTLAEVDALAACGADIIATDGTNRRRPNGESLEEFFNKARKKYPEMLFMADCSTFEDGLNAEKLGFDIVGTTLCGYTNETNGTSLPNFDLMEKLAKSLKIPVIAEGGIWSPKELEMAINCGVHAAVVGTAITRPQEITKKYINILKK
ncbi:MAG: N-acetylmannosamine-6-phosphate 2-epimerase [Oscillospiraceae bacterium]